MEIFLRENGSLIRQMATVCICMQTVQGTRDIGKMICKMDMELKVGQMDQDTRVTTRKDRSMVKEHMHGTMVQLMRVNGSITK